MIGRLNREIRRRTRVVGGFPDSDSALMLVCAGIRYVTSRSWSDRRYMDMSRLDDDQAQRHESHANSWPTANLRKKADTTDR